MDRIGINLPRILEDIVIAIRVKGGMPYLIGGAAIDILGCKTPKDFDIEVFHLSYEDLLACLTGFGEPDLIGNKFGIVKLKVAGLDMEFSVPRKENKVGLKHKDFDVELIPDLSLEEAARRRDFTVNSISIELPNGQIYDYYRGMRDLHQGILRHVDAKTFVEDPLRCFRAMQILARKLTKAAPETIELIKSMVPSCQYLSGDSIFGELNKLLMMAERPSIGLELMRETQLIRLFPELEVLVGSQQHPQWHPEGDVWTHSLLVTDAAARIVRELPEEWRLPFMYGALLHDVGKPSTLDSKFHNYGHDDAGMLIARDFLERLTNSEPFIEKVCSIVRVHMRPGSYLRNKAKRGAWRKLQNICPLNICAYIALCDASGCGDNKEPKGEVTFKKTMDIFREMGEPRGKIPAVLMGRHLIEAGHEPGTHFGPMLEKAYKYQIKHGCTDIDTLLAIAEVKNGKKAAKKA